MKSHLAPALIPSLFFLCIFLMNSSSWVSAQCHANQSSLLLKLKQGFDLSNNKLSSWISGSDCCSWEGLTCDNSTGLLIGLDLSFQWITGKIDPSLFQLHSLRTLNLSFNDFRSSPIPSGLENLTSLTHLNLSFAGLSGHIPRQISRLTRLVSLDLSLNDFYLSTIPSGLGNLTSLTHLNLAHLSFFGQNPNLKTLLHNLTALQELSLDGVNISKDGTDEWSTAISSSSLPNLRVLSLYDCSLSGAIDVSLLIQPNLRTLDISYNSNLTTSFPSFFPTNNSLEFLYLSWTLLRGFLPESISDLKSLKGLELRGCNLSGLIPPSLLLALPSLQFLDLSNNQLVGPLPEFSNQASLVSLFLNDNNFNGTVNIGVFQNFKNLSELDLSHNNFTVELDNASINGVGVYFPQLSTLGFGSCNINEFPRFLRSLPRLASLDLSNNKVKGDIPNWIWNVSEGNFQVLNLSHNLLKGIENPINLSASSLHTLDLHSNDLEGSLPIPPSAIVLDYSNNRFSGTFPINFGNFLGQPSFLSLANNKFIGEIPNSICDGPMFFEVLDISNNNFNGTIPECLVTKDTSILKLRGNNFHGTIPNGFINGSNLRTLDLNSNVLSGPIPKSLSNCNKLQVLDLGNNSLNDTFPSWLQNLPELHVLVLQSNQFHGAIEQVQIQLGFPALQIIDISSNRFTGKLPDKFFSGWKGMMIDGKHKVNHQNDDFLRDNELNYGMQYQDTVTITNKRQEIQFVKILTIFAYIDFSSNRFNGSIPKELGSFTSLRTLNLSWNSLDGPITSSLGNLSNIESMDLSHNYLSGKIPNELTRLNFLSILDLSHNRLYGRIPEGTQFSTFPNDSFEGNLGLCGLPLSSMCKTPPPPPVAIIGKATNDGEGVDWELYIVAGLGYLGGLGFALGISCSRRRGGDCCKNKWIRCWC